MHMYTGISLAQLMDGRTSHLHTLTYGSADSLGDFRDSGGKPGSGTRIIARRPGSGYCGSGLAGCCNVMYINGRKWL